MKIARGCGVCISLGAWAGISIQYCQGSHLRVVLGWCSIILSSLDLDMVVGLALKDHSKREERP